MKKLVVLIAFLVAAQADGLARDSAYQALRVLGKQRGQELLNRVIELEGRAGAPQPASWRIIVDDPAARSGVREFEVANGRIVSERTPVRTYTGSSENAVMDFTKLNLDSAGAFTIAEQEARKARMGFDNIDYVLHRDEESNMPVWVLRLVDVDRRAIGSLCVAADSGSVTQRSGFGEAARDREFVEEPPRRRMREEDPAEERGDRRRVHVGHEIDKALHRAGASLEEFFTGRRTIDRRFQDEQ